MGYTAHTRNAVTEVRYAHCPACDVVVAFALGRRTRAVASFAVDGGVVSGSGVRLGSAAELAVAERGIRSIAGLSAEHPEAAAGSPSGTDKRVRRGTPKRAEPGSAAGGGP